MTILPFPAGRTPRRALKPRRQIVDPLPQAILRSLVSDIPGPPGETDAERAARFEAQLAEVLALNPRDMVEAMLATQSVLMRLVRDATRRDAAQPDQPPGMARVHEDQAKEFDDLIAETMRTIATRQADPLGRMDVALCRAMGLGEFLIPDPDVMDETADAVSAVIVPLHPAPRMLQ